MARFSIFRAAATTGGATLASRLTGFVRDVMIAAALGAGPLADVFVIAFRLPNLFRRLFAEGAFSAAFVPIFAARLEGDAKSDVKSDAKGGLAAARQLSAEVLAVLLFSLLVFTAFAEWAMPWFVLALAQGFSANPEKFDLAVTYARITFPYLVFMSLMALYAAMLNATGRFAAAAFAPVLLNLVMISALVLSALTGGDNLQVLIWAVLVAGLLQLIVVWQAARRAGLGVPLLRPRLTPDVKRVLVLTVPGVLAAGISQINLLVGTNIASGQESAAAWLYYADRLYQLPLGVIGVALSVALLPDLARRLRAGDHDGARNSQNRGLEVALLMTLPASIGLFLLAEPILAVLFERGAFTAADSSAAALALMAFAPGLPAFVLIKVLQPSFFARENTRTPFIYGAWGVAANITVSLIFFPIYGHVAIAAATSLAGWLTFLLMAVKLGGDGWHADRRLVQTGLGIVLASAVMAVALLFAPIPDNLPAGSPALAGWLGVQVVGGAVVFLLVAVLSGGLHPAFRRQITQRLAKRSDKRHNAEDD